MVLYGMTTSIKHSAFLLLLLLPLFGCKSNGSEPSAPELLAFPGADGGGKYTTGGRGGVVYHVTNLSDNGPKEEPVPGSLRKALNAEGTRTIVFDVSGVIHLKQKLNIVSGAVTIAGQTAPGDGICLADAPVIVKTSNVIIRFIRFRLGDTWTQDEDGADALSIDGKSRIIIDHCSFSWSTDECVSCYQNKDFTLQYCIISESLRKSIHIKGNHGYGGIWGGENASFHHNLLAHHDSRNPRFSHDFVDNMHGPIDFVNNVVYDWGSNSAYGGEGSTKGAGGRNINFVANYYKPGPATGSGCKSRLFNPWKSCDNCTEKCGGTCVAPHVYMIDNVMYGSQSVTANNWSGVSYSGGCNESVCRVNERWTSGLTLLTNEQTAEQAYETVLAKAGCCLHRDVIDTRVINDVRNGSGKLIDSQKDVGGWPTYQSTKPQADTDLDGMPDSWETAHNLNPSDPNDRNGTEVAYPYTNLEAYLNEIVQSCY